MVVIGTHSNVTGSGSHTNVFKHVIVSVVGMNPSSHWKVTVDPIILLVAGKRTPSIRFVGKGHPPKLRRGLKLIITSVN